MGNSVDVICKICGTHYTRRTGGGFIFHLLHCDTCGAERSIAFDEIGEAHLRYLKGLDMPYCVATADFDRHVQETYQGKPMSEEDYNVVVEELCGKCECGGHFRFDAPARCPQCRSTDYRADPDGEMVLYD